ncbi:MAG: PAS domain S-box protein [Sediminibacterium sp.]|nr:PAS domain S-box protein [Sediminibacterium sp.]
MIASNTPNKLHAIIDASQSACLMLTPEGMILESNQVAREMFGYTETEFLHLTRNDIVDLTNNGLLTLIKNREEQKKASGEIIGVRKNGEKFPAILTSVLYHENEFGKEYVIKMITDLSETKKNERLLLETNRVANVGGWEYNILNDSLLWTDITREIHEVPDDFIPDLHKAIAFYDDPETRDQIRKEFKLLLEDGIPFDFKMIITTAKGVRKHIRAIGKAERINGITIRAYGTFQDISTEVKLREKLAQSEALFRGAFEHSAIGMSIIADDDSILQVNDALCTILGFSKEELLKLHFADFTHPDELETDKRYKNLLINNKVDSFKREKRFIHKNGLLVWAYIAVSTIRNESGSLVYYFVQIEDITKNKQVEFELAKSEEELRSLFDHNPDAVYAINTDGFIISMNTQLSKLLECSERELINKTFIPFCLPEDLPKVISHFEKVKNGVAQTYEATAITAKGTLKNVIICNIPIIVDGIITGAYGIAKDITEMKKGEQERIALIQDLTESNKDLKQFSYITSHNLRAPVTNLLALSQLINWDIIADDSNKMIFKSIEKSTQQLNNTINDLINIMVLKEKRQIPARLISFDKVFQKSLHLFEAIIEKEGIEVQTNFLQAPEVIFNEIYLESIFTNLLSNAIKFRNPNKKLLIQWSSTISAKHIILECKDNGLGIDLILHKNRLFKLFQTFHHHKESKGVGLYLIQSQLHAMGGDIQVENEPNKGSTFSIYFKKI